ncbi:hypothetical protein H6F92_12915 [Microcystis wesenbergii FACHB-1317]|uniref:glycosyltransferase 87 family protein n=1 Tax=Microcystis TaxID=1125 RepID=UPI00168061BA|nr:MULTISPECIES: glycosyltransferase 87 family protein [Microcystis]MBD2289635.1 hypothetical protein [Microcystis wesenbergii FACHB-1317]UZO75928.1 hypothetical protein M8120_25000 [Microcystis aeruginosa str. Chao 1910]
MGKTIDQFSEGLMKSRKKALLTVSGVAVLLILMFVVFGYSQTWRFWNIPVMSPPFADLRVITHGADSVAQGLDPLVSNPGDPWGRPLNYPRIWQSLYSLGVNDSHTIGLGLGIILFFLTGVIIILPNSSNMTTSLVIGTLLSPAVLLGIERANVDLLIFFLVALSIVLSRKSLVLADVIVVFATALKLFPIFGLSLLLKGRKKQSLVHSLLVLAIVCSYWFSKWSELRLIAKATPRANDLSYGMNVAWMRIESYNQSLGLLSHFICIALAFTGVCLLFVGCTRPSILRTPNENNGSINLDSFRVGSSIYIGTFLLGNNWDYRLVFLIFCIPQLACWLTSSSKEIQWCARAALCAMFVSIWYLVISRIWAILAPAIPLWMPLAGLYPWFLDEFSNWLLFWLLCYLFSIVFPQWIKDLLLYPFRPTRHST